MSLNEEIEIQQEFLEAQVFAGLKNLNTGFDSPTIWYFTKEDFEIVLNRVENFGISIFGIEPWPNEEFGGVDIYDNSGLEPNDPRWYRNSFKKFLKKGINSHFAASYGVPRKVIKDWIKNGKPILNHD